ncbi:MAG: precorrin-3B C(17)-methyltransferase [Rhizobiales bacterium]|nr:precorrin-3B C(17)-methyltransferase [Hyphomicrobiales bacterium]
MSKPAIFILGISALPLAQKLKMALGGEIHAPNHITGGDVVYAKAAQHLFQLFRAGRTIVGLCASGILIRAIGPHLSSKRDEPPVIAVAEDGSTAVPLLGGHCGANELARRIAGLCGGHAAITTASDIRFGSAFDEPADGYILGNPQDMKSATSHKLAGGEVTVEVTERAAPGSATHLIYHPLTLAIGIGCERGTSPADVISLVENTLVQNRLASASIACIASIDVKSDEPAIHAAARRFNVPSRFFTASELSAEAPRLKNPSEIVAKEVGTPGVAEAAALAAAGPASELVVEKTKGQRATCAIARAPSPILHLRGKPRGTLHVVGIGPGAREWRSPAAHAALEASTDWVGYGLYLDLAADAKDAQIEHRFPLGGEEDRVRHAINLAKDGKEVALVCSGDAGIYAMAALVYEIVDLEPCRIEINVIPGISAFQAAAAKAGAMIGHDFCCISLSDLLTPWEAIEQRIGAAAAGDFVIAFYNPRSLKRRDQLERAFAILAQHRPADTPVVIASNLGRPDEKVKIVGFSDFSSDDADMLTLVMVGSSQSKSFKRGDGVTYAYTPRGYARKREPA